MSVDALNAILKARRARGDFVDLIFASLLGRRPRRRH
jgi:hypothetical protein